MATTRIRRAAAHAPEASGDTRQIHFNPDEAAGDEWAATQEAYPAPGWTGENLLPDEAFAPDTDEADEAEWGDGTAYPAWEEDYEPLFTGDPDDAELDPLSDELLTEEERAELSRSRWQLFAGLADFAGVILGTAVILIIVTLLVSLLNWLINDLSQSFILLQKNF